MTTLKTFAFWILGAVFVYLSAWIIGHIESNAGVGLFQMSLAVLAGFLLMLAGGLLWIKTAVNVAKH